jgi:hypothetical protein
VQEIELETDSPAVLALTDGQENASSNLKQDAIDVANQAGVPVYTIGLGSGVNTSDLQDVADQTGGRFFEAPSSSDLETVYEEISQQLSSRYAVTYETSNPQLDGTQRTIDLTSTAGGTSGTESTTYLAPGVLVPLTSNFESDPQPGETAQANVEVGSESQPADDLFRATFTVEYDAGNLDVVNDEPGSFFGDDVEYRSSIDESEGTIDVGIRSGSGDGNSLQNALAKRTLNGKSQEQGTLVSLEFSVASDAPSGKDYELSLSNVDLIDSEGNPIAADPDPNEPPTVSNDQYFVQQGEVLEVTDPSEGVLANDTDPDGDVLTASLASGPSDGTLTLNEDGTLTYEPDTGFFGTDQFTYEASDSQGGTDQATVTLEINAQPVAEGETYETEAREKVVVEAPGVLANDTDPDGPDEELTVSLVEGLRGRTGDFRLTPRPGRLLRVRAAGKLVEGDG